METSEGPGRPLWWRAGALALIVAVVLRGQLSPWELTCWAAVGLVHVEVAVRLARRTTRLLLLACGLVWLADALARSVLPDGLLLSAVRDPILLHCVLTVATGRLSSRLDRVVTLLGYLCWPLLIIGALLARPGLAGLLAVRAQAYPVIGVGLVGFYLLRMLRQPSPMWPAMVANTAATAAFSFAVGRIWLTVLFYAASAAVPLAVGVQAARARTAHRLLTARDAERRRLERDIHDGVQQRLVAAALLLQQRARGGDGELLHAGIAQLDAALRELRELVHGMDPQVLDRHGLVPAIESIIDHQALPITLDNRLDGAPLPRQVASAAYYIAAEAVANAAKHARASAVTIRLARQPGAVTVSVRDDGVGGARPVTGGGLAGLRERARVLGGELRVDSPAGQGTEVCATLPV